MKKLKEQEKEKLLSSEEAEADKAKEAKKTDAQSEEKNDKYAEFEKLIKSHSICVIKMVFLTRNRNRFK